MKKVVIIVFLFVLIALVSVYIFIPSQLHLSAASTVKTNTNALYRYLSDETKWENWWPNERTETKSAERRIGELDNYSYRLTEKLYNAVDIEAENKHQIITGKIAIIPLARDSIIVDWNNILTTSLNPFTRIRQYRQALNAKKNMTVILDSLKSFAENKEKVYKYHIRHTTLTDTFFVALKTITTSYPTTEFIYRCVGNLRSYINNQKAKEVDYPILNITEKDSSHYEMMVAIPTNVALNGTGNIAFKRMVVFKDKILTADVLGGPANIRKAYEELNVYMRDYNLVSPVIHWETLITDRSREKDSTKWITKICIPIV